MGQSTAFDTINVPHVCGIKLAVSISSPSSASEDVAEWLGEISEAVSQIDRLVFTDVLDPADRRGLISFKCAGEKLLTLTTTIRRELAITKGVVDALTQYLPDACEHEPAPPLRRAVDLLRGQKEWRRMVDAFDDAEADDETGVPNGQFGLAATEALEALINFPVPDIQAFYEKLRIIETTGTVANKAFFTALLHDAANLAQPLAPIPTPNPAPAVSRGSILFWLDLMRQGKTDHATEVMEAALGQLPETEEA